MAKPPIALGDQLWQHPAVTYLEGARKRPDRFLLPRWAGGYRLVPLELPALDAPARRCRRCEFTAPVSARRLCGRCELSALTNGNPP